MKEVTFEPFQKVLVRDDEDKEWRVNFFSHVHVFSERFSKYVCAGHMWEYCIPYEGNERLLGTTDKPQPPDGCFKEEHFTNYRHSDWYGENLEEELKPFQPVLVRDFDHNEWHINFFERKCGDYFLCFSGNWKQCLPFNDETAHLLGTTNSPTQPVPDFRFGDKVEVWDGNSQEWRKAIFLKMHMPYYFCILDSEATCCWKQCRHADW